MNVLVTGGAGYIGGFLVERLVRDGHRVTVLDRFSRGKARLPFWEQFGRSVRLIACDISSRKQLAGISLKGTEWIFHLAGRSAAGPSFTDPLSYHETNVSGTLNILEAARAVGVSRFLFAGTAAVYGNAATFPTPETAPCMPESPFGLTKLLAEQLVLHWGQVYHLPVISLRMFSVYGPKSPLTETYGAVLTTLMAHKISGMMYRIQGDGKQARDFVHVLDAVEAMIRVMRSSSRNEVFNVGTGVSTSITDLIGLVGIRAEYTPETSVGTQRETRADIRKMHRLLTWRPSRRLTAVSFQ